MKNIFLDERERARALLVLRGSREIPDNAASRSQYIFTGGMYVVYPAVSSPDNQAGTTEGGAAFPEADGDPGVQAAHEEERQEVQEDEIYRIQHVLVVFLDIGHADDIDVAGVEMIADGLDVEKPGRGVYSRQNPYHADHHPQTPSG